MNITPQVPTLPLATVVNPQADTLRRENNIREMIAQPAAASQSAAEKGVASDKDRARTPAQQNEQIDFTGIRKKAEEDDTTINDSSKQNDQDASGQNQDNQDFRQANNEAEEQAQALAEEKLIRELSARDAEVKRHENAHAATGGSVTGAPSYEYRKGPDGKSYAVSGEVSVDMSTIAGDPAATIAKMQKVHAAALAPADPSSQDKKIAATATKIILQAQSELMALANEKDPVSENKPAVQAESENQNEYQSGNDNDFDSFINQTLQDQESIAPSRSEDVVQRASRVESFYHNINQAYEKAPNHHFQLTA